MELPNKHLAIIPPEKISGYLLSENHPVGKWKAKYLASVGFDSRNSNHFMTEIANLAKNGIVSDVIETQYGTKYIIHGNIDTLRGKSITVKTIWIIEKGENIPRFVTLYPL